MSDEDLAYGEYAAKVGTAIHDYIHSALTGEKTAPSEVKLADSAKKMIKNVVIPKIVKRVIRLSHQNRLFQMMLLKLQVRWIY